LRKKDQSVERQARADAPPATPGIIEVAPDIFQFRGEKPSSHVYVIRGQAKNVLIDTGVAAGFSDIKRHLSELGLRVKDINLVVLTHEHFDHIGAAAFFHPTAVVAAHRLAANKVELQDEFVTFHKYRDELSKPFWVDIWMEDGSIVDLGNHTLYTLHTPGHTSGCMCLYEPEEGLLFTGDTMFAGGTLSEISVGGNVSDYMNSVQRLSHLKVRKICPGHGRISDTPEEDLPKAIGYAQSLLGDCKMFFEAFIKTRQLQDKIGSAFGFWKETQKPW